MEAEEPIEGKILIRQRGSLYQRNRDPLISGGDCERGVFAQGERVIRSIGFMLEMLLGSYVSREHLGDSIHTYVTRKLVRTISNSRKTNWLIIFN